MITVSTIPAALVVGLSALVAAGCGSDSDDRSGAYVPGPLYLVSHSLYSDDGVTSYLTVLDSLAAGTAIDLRDSLELGGGARAYGPPGADVVYVTSTENGTMTEVTFKPDGSPRVGRVVSFVDLGIGSTTGGNVHHFVSPTKAYFVSQDSLEIVVWNPATMHIVKTVPLDLPPDPTATGLAFYPQAIVVGDQIVLLSSASDADDVSRTIIVTVVDTVSDQIVSNTVETRCHALAASGVDVHGDRYFASDGYSVGVYHFLPDQAPPACVLRMRAGETSFDPNWSRTLTPALGTGLWTGVSPGAGGKLYVQAIAESAPAVAAATEPYDVTVAQPWRWYSLADGDAAPVAVDTSFLPTPPLFPAIAVGETQYVSVWDDVDTTLIDLTSAETPRAGLVVPGFAFNVVQLR